MPDAIKKIMLLSIFITAVCLRGIAAQEPQNSDRQNDVIIVFKTHFDIGYTDLARNVIHRYRTSMIDNAVEVATACESLPSEQQFIWTLPGWPMKNILEDWQGQTPERKRQVIKALNTERFVVHALPFTLHTESLELEDLVRGLRYSVYIEQLSGRLAPRAAKMTDVPSHSWVLPTLLKHAGVDFLHLGCNPACRSPEVPKLFWWEGPDGSRLLTFYSAGDYGERVLPPKDWPYKTWLAMQMTGDNHGPPRPKQVTQLIEKAKKAGARVRIGRLSDFADAILKEKPNLPVIRGDMPDTWIHGISSMPLETKFARNLRPEIFVLEALNTLLHLWHVEVEDISSLIGDAYENSLCYGEHTWGMNDPHHGDYGSQWKANRKAGKYKKQEESWREKGSHIWKLHKAVRPELEQHLRILAENVQISGKRIVVFNSLPGERSGMVRVKYDGRKPATLLDTDNKKVVAVAESRPNELCFIAQDVPPLGYRTYVFSEQKTLPTALLVSAKNRTIENEFFKIVVDPSQGAITSIYDKRAERELVNHKSSFGFGQYMHERFSKKDVDAYTDVYLKTQPQWAYDDIGKVGLPEDIPYQVIKTQNMRISFNQNDVYAQVKMEAGACPRHKGITLTVTLYTSLPYVDIAWAIDKKTADSWPQADWLSFPFQITKPDFRLARLGGIIDPATDIIPGSNQYIFCLNGGMAVIGEDGYGAGLCALDSPLVSLDQPGLWKYSDSFTAKRANVFVNLYNNQWDTNFQEWTDDSWTSEVRIWAIHKYDPEAELITRSEEARIPLKAAVTDGRAGKLPPVRTGISLSQKGVSVTALGPNLYGKGMILRLWERAGKDRRCRVVFPDDLKVKTVQPCNLRGKLTGDSIAIEDNGFEVSISHNAPASFFTQFGQSVLNLIELTKNSGENSCIFPANMIFVLWRISASLP